MKVAWWMSLAVLSCRTPPSGSSELDEGEAGAFMFLSDNEEQLEECHAVPGTGHVTKDSRPPCEEGRLNSFLPCLQVINPLSVITLAVKNKLDKTCRNVSKVADKMQKYLQSCSLQPRQEGYARVLRGVIALHKKLCSKDPYHKRFLSQRQCYARLQRELETCLGPADWTDSSEPDKLCHAYRQVADCYYVKSAVLCGPQAASVLKELVTAVSDSVLTVDCAPPAPPHFGSLSANHTSRKSSSCLCLRTSQRLLLTGLAFVNLINYYL